MREGLPAPLLREALGVVASTLLNTVIAIDTGKRAQARDLVEHCWKVVVATIAVIDAANDGSVA